VTVGAPRSRAVSALLAGVFPGLFLLAGCSSGVFVSVAEDGVPKGGRDGKIEDGPCGPIARVRASNMRKLASIPGIRTDRVFEMDMSGRTKASWLTPVDAAPVAVSGTRLLVQGYGRHWIGTDGSISRAGRRQLPESRPAPQCRLPAELKSSDYAACRSFTDLASGSQRLIAFEAACT
jgi:hypothetical protein